VYLYLLTGIPTSVLTSVLASRSTSTKSSVVLLSTITSTRLARLVVPSADERAYLTINAGGVGEKRYEWNEVVQWRILIDA